MLPIMKGNGKKIRYSAVVVGIKIQKKKKGNYHFCNSSNIVPNNSLYQPLLHVGSVFCVFEVVFIDIDVIVYMLNFGTRTR